MSSDTEVDLASLTSRPEEDLKGEENKSEVLVVLPVSFAKDSKDLESADGQDALGFSPQPGPSGDEKKYLETSTYKLLLPLSRSVRGLIGRGPVKTSSTSGSPSSRSSSRGSANDNEKRRKRRKLKKRKKRRKRKKKHPNIDIPDVLQFSDQDEENVDQDLIPPDDLSPRSKMEFARAALKRKSLARKRRKLKKILKMEKDKKKLRKRKRKRRKKDKKGDEAEEGGKENGSKRGIRSEDHFYPTPQSLKRKRLFSQLTEPKPVKCSICNGLHYRTKRNFASNLRIIINVNRAFTQILSDMRNKMRKIDVNLVKVRKNLDFLESMYEDVFRRVNRLIA